MKILLPNGKMNRKYCAHCGGTGKIWELIWPYDGCTKDVKLWTKLVKKIIIDCDCENETS